MTRLLQAPANVIAVANRDLIKKSQLNKPVVPYFAELKFSDANVFVVQQILNIRSIRFLMRLTLTGVDVFFELLFTMIIVSSKENQLLLSSI